MFLSCTHRQGGAFKYQLCAFYPLLGSSVSFYLASMFIVFTRMFFMQAAAASWTRSSVDPVNVNNVC